METMHIIGIIFLCVLACLALWCMAKFGFFAPDFERPKRPGIPNMKNPPPPPPVKNLPYNNGGIVSGTECGVVHPREITVMYGKPQPKWVKFNLNDDIRVKFTEKGYERMAELWNDGFAGVVGFSSRTPDHYKAEADAEGWTKMQLWEFIESFGKIPHMTLDLYVETTILLNAANLTPSEYGKL